MPLLDVTDILFDPDLADTFNVLRRTEVVGGNGRSQVTEARSTCIVGVVTMASPDDLKRFPDAQLTGRTIMVCTPFRLRASGDGFQPDQIEYDGNLYTVVAIDPYTRFGAGFVEALATSPKASDQPPL